MENSIKVVNVQEINRGNAWADTAIEPEKVLRNIPSFFFIGFRYYNLVVIRPLLIR